MEKKTIGKFISVLRKANGMTQRELGELLYVSDKTVSRWERDECTPDISLISSIAEIFGVTADELLSGERKSCAENSSDFETANARLNAKSDKQISLMIDKRLLRFKNLSIISVCLALLGLFGAAMWNFGFSSAYIGFFNACAFLFVGAVLQLVLTLNFRIGLGEPEYETIIRNANSSILRITVNILTVIVLIFAFVLPLFTEVKNVIFGLSSKSWFKIGFICSLVTLVCLHILYVFFIRRLLEERGLVYFDEAETERNLRNRKLLIKTVCFALFIEILLGACFAAVNLINIKSFSRSTTFNDWGELQKYVSEAEEKRYVDIEYYWDGGNIVSTKPINSLSEIDEIGEKTFIIRDEDGKMLFAYSDNPAIHAIDFTKDNNGKDCLPAKVYLNYDIDRAYYEIVAPLQSLICFLAVANIVICAVIYSVKKRAGKSTAGGNK